MYPAQVVAVSEDEKRHTRRRVVSISAFARDASEAIKPVIVTDLSPEGCTLTGDSGFLPDGIVWVKIQGLVARKADICWAEDGVAGCRFHLPLNPSMIDQLVSSSRQSFRQLKGRFTVRPVDGPSGPRRTGTAG